MFVCVFLPLMKQCQAVGGQEKLQPMSSSSETEDLVDTAEPHSLFVCGNRKEKHHKDKTAPMHTVSHIEPSVSNSNKIITGGSSGVSVNF